MSLKTFHVISGDYIIKRDEPVKLQAFLGTCLGVAIIDHNKNIGGLIHLLLPKPLSSLSNEFPYKYASTGMPLFIDQLRANGADTENMRAYIAGGALVGPVSEQDMALDIGGRTAEVVTSIIKDNGIKIEHSETGGFFSCCLELNLKNSVCLVKPIYEDTNEQSEFVPPDGREILRAVDNLQPIPQVALKILRLLGEDEYNIKEIASEVRKDQVISAKIIQLCNSSFFSMRRKIESIDDAIIVLGLNQLIKIVITSSINKYYSQNYSGYSLCKGGLFHHAVGSASIAEAIAIRTKKVSSGIAYTAGLIHDIGIAVLDQYVNDSKPFFYRELERDSSILTMEKNLFGITHVEVGKKLAVKWKFTELLTDAIKFHHTPEKAVKNRDIVNILYVADLIMTRFNAAISIGEIRTGDLEEKFNGIGLSIDQLPELVELIPTGDAIRILQNGA